MTEHSATLYIRDMLESARRAIEISAGVKHEDLRDLDIKTLALRKLLEIIGEASRRVGIAFKESHPQIEWKRIAGMRDRLIHGYDTIDYRVLWDTCTSDLPPLVVQLEKILTEETGE